VGFANPALATSSSTITVCGGGCAYSQLAPALAAAHPGATVHVGPGVYRGGVTITRSVTLTGAGADRTVVRGGGPVVTVGTFGATHQPTVTISGLTVTGGLTQSSFAFGGGIYVPPSAHYGRGATLTLREVSVRGNTAAAGSTFDSGIPCGHGDCAAALSGGGGIDSWGNLTIDRSNVVGNRSAGAQTSDADGAGVYEQNGSLTITNSVVRNNQNIAKAPNGRYAEGAGIMADAFFSGPFFGGDAPTISLTLRGTTVSDNASRLSNNLPSSAGGQVINTGANAGGIHVGDDVPTALTHVSVNNNIASSTFPKGGESGAIDAGMIVGDSDSTMHDVRMTGNRTTTLAATTADIGSDGTTLELDGGASITGLNLSNNSSVSNTPHGDAAVNGALAILNFSNDTRLVSISNSTIDDNTALATTRAGTATSEGAGVFNNGILTLRHVQVDGNIARVAAPHGHAQGGGIWNGVELSGPPVDLTLTHAQVEDNRLVAGTGVTRAGGGLYTTEPVTRTRTRITHNVPDQCTGC
jgi:hypothetical protein